MFDRLERQGMTAGEETAVKPWMRVLAPVVAGLSLVGAAQGSEWRSPESVDGAVTTSVQEAEALYESNVPFIDVRSQRQFDRRHIKGAYNLDLKNNYTADALEKVAAKDQPFVIYCNGPKCSRSYRACEQAVGWGFEKVYYFRGGIADWRRAGLPVASAD